MRHSFSPHPVALHPRGMDTPPVLTRLIAAAGPAHGLSARPRSTACIAVDLPAITAAANNHLGTAARAQEQATRNRLGLPTLADETWTNTSIGSILVLHSCPARCGARRRCRTCRLRAAPCLPTTLAGSCGPAEPANVELDSSETKPTRSKRSHRHRGPTLVGAIAPPAVGPPRRHDHANRVSPPFTRGF